MKFKRLILLSSAGFVLVGCNKYGEIDASSAKSQIELMKEEINMDSFIMPLKLTVESTMSMKISSYGTKIDSLSETYAVLDKTDGEEYYHDKSDSLLGKANVWLYAFEDKYIYALESGSLKQYTEYDLASGKEKFDSLTENYGKPSMITCLDNAITIIDKAGTTDYDGTKYGEAKIYSQNAGNLEISVDFASQSSGVTANGNSIIAFDSYLVKEISSNTVYGNSASEESTMEVKATYDWGAAEHAHPDLTTFSKTN